MANENLEVVYKVGHSDDPLRTWTLDYDHDPRHYGERNYLDAIELASEWMRAGYRIVVVADSSVEIIRAGDMGVSHSNTDRDHRHWKEHLAILNALREVWKEIHIPAR